MRLAVNICSMRPRKYGAYDMRRMTCLGLAAKSLGHDVVYHVTSPATFEFLDKQGRIDPSMCTAEARGHDVYICNLRAAPGLYARGLNAGTPMAVWEIVACLPHNHPWPNDIKVACSPITRPADFTTPKDHGGIDEWTWPPESVKVIPTLHTPHDLILSQFQQDGIIDAYCGDDLATIRLQYLASGGPSGVGFRGAWNRERSSSRIRLHDSYDFRFKPLLSAKEYLSWMASKQAILNLQGDRWKCYRHTEAIIMGVPVVCLRDTINVSPRLTPDDAIIIDQWDDKEAIDRRLLGRRDIVASADKKYREGWSLMGQVRMALDTISTGG